MSNRAGELAGYYYPAEQAVCSQQQSRCVVSWPAAAILHHRLYAVSTRGLQSLCGELHTFQDGDDDLNLPRELGK